MERPQTQSGNSGRGLTELVRSSAVSKRTNNELSAIGCIWYIWRGDRWPLHEVIGMWRAAKRSPNRDTTLATDIFGGEDTTTARFFFAAAARRYDEATEWYCVNGCCVVIWGHGKRGNMGGYGPAGCSCDDLDDPRDIARGQIGAKQ